MFGLGPPMQRRDINELGYRVTQALAEENGPPNLEVRIDVIIGRAMHAIGADTLPLLDFLSLVGPATIGSAP